MDEEKAPTGILLSEGILIGSCWLGEGVCYFLQLHHHQKTAHAPVNNLPSTLKQAVTNSGLYVQNLHIKAGRELFRGKKEF